MPAWQDIFALAVVALAAASLLRRGWRLFFQRAAGGCGSCGTCSGSSRQTQPAVTTISLLPATDQRDH